MKPYIFCIGVKLLLDVFKVTASYVNLMTILCQSFVILYRLLLLI